jgi:pteridine reductase
MKQTAPLAIITGSAKRIGKALAVALHESGYNVAIHFNKSKNEAQELVNNLNLTRANSAKCYQAELTCTNDIENMITRIFDWQKNLKVLINNASVFLDDKLARDNWQKLFDCNVRAPYILSSMCFEKLKEHNGCIVNITDQHALSPLKNYDIYCMTKSALESQTKSLAKNFAPDVRVNAVAPGAILWPEKTGDGGSNSEQQRALLQRIPLNRLGGAQVIADTALFLATNDYITGEVIRVDGGRLLT